MKVKIGKYSMYLGPYQVVDWFKPIFGEDRIDKFTDGEFFEKWSEKSMPFFTWLDSKKHRKIEIKIDKFDTWGMDHTLGLIVLPMLKQLQATKHGSGMVANEDVPEELRSTSLNQHQDLDDDDLLHARWEWALAEMIWAFEQIVDDNNEDQFHTGISDLQFVDLNDGSGMSEIVAGPKDTHVFHKKESKAHHKRINNGLLLFGKYFRDLWD